MLGREECGAEEALGAGGAEGGARKSAFFLLSTLQRGWRALLRAESPHNSCDTVLHQL